MCPLFLTLFERTENKTPTTPMYTQDGKMLCDATGTTIDPKGHEGYFIYTDENDKEHHLCALGHALFNALIEEWSFRKNLPEEAQKRFVWVFVGSPNSCLFGGEFRDKVARWEDEAEREKKAEKRKPRKS